MIIHAKIVGVKVANPDHIKRKEILNDCKKGELLMLERERDNPHDNNAVAVLRLSREKLGYLSHDAAVKIAKQIDEDSKEFEAVIEKVNGGKKSLLGSILGGEEKPYEVDIVITKKYTS